MAKALLSNSTLLGNSLSFSEKLDFTCTRQSSSVVNITSSPDSLEVSTRLSPGKAHKLPQQVHEELGWASPAGWEFSADKMQAREEAVKVPVADTTPSAPASPVASVPAQVSPSSL